MPGKQAKDEGNIRLVARVSALTKNIGFATGFPVNERCATSLLIRAGKGMSI